MALQKSLNDLEQAYENFLSLAKEMPVKLPKLNKHKHKQSACFRKGSFQANERTVYLAKVGKRKMVW
jgi:hypothetical protein